MQAGPVAERPTVLGAAGEGLAQVGGRTTRGCHGGGASTCGDDGPGSTKGDALAGRDQMIHDLRVELQQVQQQLNASREEKRHYRQDFDRIVLRQDKLYQDVEQLLYDPDGDEYAATLLNAELLVKEHGCDVANNLEEDLEGMLDLLLS